MSGDRDSKMIDAAFSRLFVPGGTMLPPRPPTADDETCPKCGFAGKVDEGWKTFVYFSREMALKSRLLNGECLFVRCSRCGFHWSESVVKPEP